MESLVRRMTTLADFYKGKKVFEIEFYVKKNGRTREYEYKIDPANGKILYREAD